MGDFLTDVQTLRANARKEIEKGPVTASYGADVERVIEVLNQALATEIVCVLRYKQHHYNAQGLDAGPVAQEFLEHAGEEQQHADSIAARITQLGGTPDFSPDTLLARSHSEYNSPSALLEMVAERVAIASYTEMINWLGTGDITTRRMLEEILAVEEEHAEDMLSFLQKMN